MRIPSPKQEQQAVNDWNASHPVGTQVIRYRRLNPLREPEQTTTNSAAWLMGGHTAVIKVACTSGAVSLSSVTAADKAGNKARMATDLIAEYQKQ